MDVQQNPIFEDAPEHTEEPWSGAGGPALDGPQSETQEAPQKQSTTVDVLEAPHVDASWAPPSSLDPLARMPAHLQNRVAAISDDDWLHDQDLAGALDSHRSKVRASWSSFGFRGC